MEEHKLSDEDLMLRAKKIHAEHHKGYRMEHPKITKLTPLLKDD